MAVMVLTKVYMETVVVNNTKYDVLVEEEARLVRFSLSDKHGDDDCDNAKYDDYYGDNGAMFVTASADIIMILMKKKNLHWRWQY